MISLKLDTPELTQITLETERYYTQKGSSDRHYSVTTILKHTSQTTFNKSPALDQAIHRGNLFHSAMENILQLPDNLRRKHGAEAFNSIIPGIWQHLEGLVIGLEPALIEQFVVFSKNGFSYAGAVDLVAIEGNGSYTLIDWKTAGFRKKQSQLKDYKCQLGAYTQALRSMGVPIRKAQLAIAHPDGVQEIVLKGDDLEKQIDIFNTRLEMFYDIKILEERINKIHGEKQNIQ